MDQKYVRDLESAQQARREQLRERIAEAVDWYSAGPQMLVEAVVSAAREALKETQASAGRVREMGRAAEAEDSTDLRELLDRLGAALTKEAVVYTVFIASVQQFCEATVGASPEDTASATNYLVKILQSF